MLVAINSVFQIVMYSVLGWFYLSVLPGWLGPRHREPPRRRSGTSPSRCSSSWASRSLAGFLTRTIGEARKGTDWYEQTVPAPHRTRRLWGLLFTIVVLFALQGKQITTHPLDVARVAIPLLVYFAVMWSGSFLAGYRLGFPYDRNASVAFTAAGNNFELAIAVSIAVFGVTSGQALAGTIGPLIEVPALITLVYVSLWARRRWYRAASIRSRAEQGRLAQRHGRQGRSHVRVASSVCTRRMWRCSRTARRARTGSRVPERERLALMTHP